MTTTTRRREAARVILAAVIVAATLVSGACGVAALVYAVQGLWLGAGVHLLAMLGAAAIGVSLNRDFESL